MRGQAKGMYARARQRTSRACGWRLDCAAGVAQDFANPQPANNLDEAAFTDRTPEERLKFHDGSLGRDEAPDRAVP